MASAVARPQPALFLSGNEALARGAWEAGVEFAAAYPGTPATEILESLADCRDVYCEWSVNEKLALEAALGASILGRRALCSMKHVGLNVAADTLMSTGLTGVSSGLLIAVSDDVGFASSQNEQDSRYWGHFAHLPVLEPADAREAYAMAREAFALAERFCTPVILRLTTRVSHVKRAVRVAGREPRRGPAYEKDTRRWMVTPNHVGAQLESQVRRDAELRAFAERTSLNEVLDGPDRRIGFVSSGPASLVVREAYPRSPLLKLGLTHPIPLELARRFASGVEKMLVVEEVEPLFETGLRAAGIRVHGKNLLPAHGEVHAETLERAVSALLGAPPSPPGRAANVFARPPTLCAGCPYLSVYFWLARFKDAIVTGDIGCYTLGCGEPWNAGDTCFSMGASVGIAHGLAKALEGEQKARPVIATIGDSTFLHSGMPGLLNMTYHRANVTVLLLDNRSTAMTGGQNNPGNGRDLRGEPAPRVDFAGLCEALGVRRERIRVVDPYELPNLFKVLREEIKAAEPSVVITTRPCVLSADFTREPPLRVKDDGCNGCARCLDVGCPAITVRERRRETRGSGRAVELAFVAIDAALCTGCGICAQACARGAIAA